MDKQEKFELVYKRIVDENASNMEKCRNEVKARSISMWKFALLIISFWIFTITAIVVLGINYMPRTMNTLKILGILAIISTVFTLIISMKYSKKIGPSKIGKYIDYFKSKVIETLLHSFNDSLQYESKSSIPKIEYTQADFESFEKYSSKDLVYGIISKNCKFKMAEVETWVNTKDTFITTFKGLFAQVEMPKPFKETIHLRINKKNVPFDNLKIQLDYEEFENIFDVYASNKIIAMQLLTAEVMQKLIELYNETKILYEITIKNSHIFIRFPYKKWFGVAIGGIEEFSIKVNQNVENEKTSLEVDAEIEKLSLDKEKLYKYYRILDFTFEISNMLINLINDTQYE